MPDALTNVINVVLYTPVSNDKELVCVGVCVIEHKHQSPFLWCTQFHEICFNCQLPNLNVPNGHLQTAS